MTWNFIAPILLLCCSNVFMTFAWVSHRRAAAREQILWIYESWRTPRAWARGPEISANPIRYGV